MAITPGAVSLKSQRIARTASGAGALALAALAAVHVLRSDLDPSWHLINEYAMGRHGWLITTCFVALAAGSASLSVALKPQIRTRMGRIGLVLLFLAAFGLAMAALFPTDPPAASRQAASWSDRLHGVSSTIEVPGEILAMLLLSLALRNRTLWGSLPLLGLTVVVWLSLAIMLASIMTAMQPSEMDGPGLVGIANRTLIVAYAVWVIVMAWPLARARARAYR